MYPESIKGTGVIRYLFLAGLLSILLGTLIQLDLPTVQDIRENLIHRVVERQLQLQTSKEEDLLKEGWIYFNIGEYEKAKMVMEKVAGQDRNTSALYCLGLIDMKYRRWEDARTRLELVTEKSPGHAASRVNLGKAYFQLRYYGQAGSQFEEAVHIEPTDEEARLWLGKTYLKLNEVDLAVNMLETVTHGKEAVEAAALMKNLR